MARSSFTVTYDIVTPESAEHGDCAEQGYVTPGGWHYDLNTVLADKEGDYSMTLREAMNLVPSGYDCGTWFAQHDGSVNYRTGAETTYSLHPPRHITPSSYRRIAHLLGNR